MNCISSVNLRFNLITRNHLVKNTHRAFYPLKFNQLNVNIV
jgi:hypothetical protein